ncbi:Phosphodiesterase yfcE [Slackia heliotrinireducens]|uniref:Phosphoesterase n=1 Tax=Slackia heliotrinireducens (strain ATCC 29202 / DSM 20476 / NCTC 11029 / RHS 1) TaxID=471855 RepID=C7N3V5_SLAHD|nr:phosphodiesterase [Slackia heliotrinireducens]ACV21696.1 phosphoesterase, MJ0936 family [Slackia heliotrinireducens DSM 20476]VEG99331.1 Phosphodiesterase yfcE [Slackia heliotrinireducens]
MKLLIASDIHGSAYWCRRLFERIQAESPDRIVLLGDLLYHGPRNDLPRDYAPKEVIPLLNGVADRVVAVRGNCDAEVDQMVLDFPCMADYAVIMDGGRQLFLTHGHVFSPENMPVLPDGSAFLSGHTHVKCNKDVVMPDGRTITVVNPGSVSIPKDGSSSYAVYQDGAFFLKEL